MLYPKDARYPDLQQEIIELFTNLQLELVACESCGEYHPPESHLQPMVPFDPSEPEEA